MQWSTLTLYRLGFGLSDLGHSMNETDFHIKNVTAYILKYIIIYSILSLFHFLNLFNALESECYFYIP